MNGPHGYLKDCLPSGKSESEVRQQRISMFQVIKHGAELTMRDSTHASCPFCGADPLIAVQIAGKFVVGCESENCPADVQVSAPTLDGAWALWNRRAP